MKMWLSFLVLLCSAYSINCGDPPKGFTLKTISLQPPTEPDEGVKLLKVCTTQDFSAVLNYASIILGVAIKDTHPFEKILYEYEKESNDADSKCKFFNDTLNIPTYKDKPIFFTMQARNEDGEPLTSGAATFAKLPGKFFEDKDVTSQNVGKWTGSTTTHSLRPTLKANSLRLVFSEALGDWKLCVGGAVNNNIKCSTDNLLCYAIEVGDEKPEYSLCMASDVGDTILNGVILSPNPATKQETVPENVVLTYGYTTYFKGTNKETKMTIKSESAEDLEFVPYINGSVIYEVCQKSETDCDLTTYIKGDNGIKVLIVNAATPQSETSDVLPFKDYNITGTNLGATVIEVYWKRGAEKYYGAKVDNADDKIHEVVVDCSDDDIDGPNKTHCYAYFINLVPNDYLVTVAPGDGVGVNDLNPRLTNQITSAPITVESLMSSARNMGVIWQQDSSHADDVLQVCYNAPENKQNNTRYEAIIIDGHGHWTKIYQSTHYEEPISCFSPVNLLTSSLKISEDTKLTLVVVERELYGYQVLVSGQANIDLAALRMSKANQESSSEGGSTSTLAIVGAAIAGIACLMALVAAAILFVMKRRRNNDGLQYPLQRTTIENTNVINGLDNLNSIY